MKGRYNNLFRSGQSFSLANHIISFSFSFYKNINIIFQNADHTSRQDDVGKENLNNSVPIKGIWDKPLLSFQEAVQIANVPNLDINDIYLCLDHFEEAEDPPPGLIIDEACAIRFYTMPTPFYVFFNHALRTRDRDEAKPFFPFLQLLLLAIHKLPKAKGILFRGTKNLPSEVIDEYKRKADTKKCVYWGACSSTTTNVATLQAEIFCGKEGNRVKFVIQDCEVGVSVEALSALQLEREVLLPPCLRFKVEGYVDYGNGLLEFQLRYSAPRCEMIPLVPPPQFLSSSS